MKARSWFFGFLFLIVALLFTFLPLQNKSPLQKSGNFANHLVSVYSINNRDKTKLEAANFEEAFKETKERVASQFEITTHHDNTFKISEDQERSKTQNIEEFLTKKPTFIMTDEEGRPLFFRGVFNKQSVDFFLNGGFREEEFRVPIGPTSAKYRFDINTNQHVIDLEGQTPAADYELTKAKLDALNNRQKIYFWLDYKKFILQAQEEDTFEWVKNEKNPLKYAINRENNLETYRSLQGLHGAENFLDLLEVLNTKSGAKPFLIGGIRIDKVNANTAFSIYANFSAQSAKSIAATINYGNADYLVKKDYSYIHTPSPYSEASTSSLWILLILFLTFVGFLILNYRILGLFFSLFFGMGLISAFNFTTSALQGYSQIVFVVLLLCLVSVATNIVNLFESLRVEFARFLSLDRAWVIVSKRTLSSWFFANVFVALCATLLFYNRYTFLSQLGFGLLISLGGIGIFGVLLPRFFFLLFFKSFFDLNHWWLGLQNSRGPESTLFFRFLKHKISGQLQVFARLVQNLLVVGLLITLLTFYFKSQNTFAGFALDPNESAKELVVISSSPFKALSTSQLKTLETILERPTFESISLETKILSENPKAYVALLTSQNSEAIIELEKLLASYPSFETHFYSKTTLLTHDLRKTTYFLFLGFFAIQYAFSLLIWRLSFAMTLLSSSSQAIFAFVAPLAFSRVFITPDAVIYLILAFLLYNQNSIMSMTRIRLHITALVGSPTSNIILSKRDISNSARLAALESAKPRLISFALVLEIVFLKLIFGWDALSILSWVGISLALTVTGIGLLSRIYTSFLELQFQFKHQRWTSGFWEFQNPVEQTFTGINDINY